MFFAIKLVFKSRPLHFLTNFTGEKWYFPKNCPLLQFTGKSVFKSKCLMDVRMIEKLLCVIKLQNEELESMQIQLQH